VVDEEVVDVEGVSDVDVGPAPLVPWPVGGPAATEVVGEVRVTEAPDKPPRVRLAGLVWKLSTPASPAAVAPITIGARLTA